MGFPFWPLVADFCHPAVAIGWGSPLRVVETAIRIARVALVVEMRGAILGLSLLLAMLIARSIFVVCIRIGVFGFSVGSVRVTFSAPALYRKAVRVWKSRSESS